MSFPDYVVLAIYLAGTLGLGIFYYFRTKTSEDMFTAGGQSPWWVSGLSSFMTVFSAATFVVWGGIAYQYGIVALSINMSYGAASLLVGYFVASKWKSAGVRTPSEYISLRFGEGAVHFYIWIMMAVKVLGSAIALYGLSVLISALMPLPDRHMLQDPQTGNLSVTWAIIIFGCIVVLYTMAGGLWGVLMTDVIQFIILTLSVIFVVPLMLIEVGGFQSFVDRAPDKFFDLVAGEYTWFFLIGWGMVNFFMIGAEWAFAQRFISVRNETEAKKSAYLLGILYLVSPFFWLSPPLLYRVLDPSANPEQAYILASQLVLPAGMLGMMVAAMFSATASMVSSQLNVFAGVLTNSLYRGRVRPNPSEGELLWIGRGFSLVLGAALIGIAIIIPDIGGATAVVISNSSLIIGTMLAPSIWGLFSRKLSVSAVWTVAAVSAASAFVLKFALQEIGFLSDVPILLGIAAWAQKGGLAVDLTIGTVMPVLVLTVFQTLSRGENSGWKRLQDLSAKRAVQAAEVGNPPFDPTPGWVVTTALGMISTMMFITAAVSDGSASLLTFAGATFVMASVAGGMTMRRWRKDG